MPKLLEFQLFFFTVRGCWLIVMPNLPSSNTHGPVSRERRDFRQERRASSAKRGYNYQWRKIRAWFLFNFHPLCVVCEENGDMTPATEVDHIHGFRDTDDPAWSDPANLQGLCKTHHAQKTARDQAKKRE